MRTRSNTKRLIFVALAVAAITAISLMWLRSTSVSAQKSGALGVGVQAASSVEEAREALAQAQAQERIKRTKDAGRQVEAALQGYIAAVNARIEAIFARMQELDALMGIMTTEAFDLPVEQRKEPPAALLAEYNALQTELLAINPEPLAPGNLNATVESEPNNTCPTADDLALTANVARVGTGSITAGDIDFWSFTAPAGSRVWAYVDTGGGQSSPLNDRDSFLSLFGANCGALIEEDDDDGTGNGGDSVTESTFSSVIAGAPLAAAGTYTLAVEGFGPTSVINPYRLFVIVTTGAGSAEAEPNNTAATANPGLLAGANSVVKTGSITPAGDVDFFTVVANAGDVFFIAGDGNPERDATNTDLVLDITHPDGRTLMQPPVDSGLGGSPTNPEGEGFSFAVPISGTYAVSVRGFGVSTGTYGLVIARSSPRTICPTTTFTGILGQNSAENPGVSGIQLGRLNRFVDQTGACNNVRTCPGLFSAVGARPFDAYTFNNPSSSPACVTVIVDAQACLGNNFLVVAAYSGPSYDPTNQCLNYLADIGGSPNPTGVFSFNVPATSSFTLVITAANASPTVCTTPYRVTVVGLPNFTQSIQDPVTGNTLLFNCTTGNATFFNCATGVSVSGRVGCIQQIGSCNLFIGGGGGNKGGPLNVSGVINTCTGEGSATVTIGGVVVNLSDPNVNNNGCFCP
ncbi:MAG TPA: DVUA0089 family protein [Blastocatellia bacterium]|nr:DVUA0089 family protein [Blastocatellia bacterium]